jgi:hypothetical protein
MAVGQGAMFFFVIAAVLLVTAINVTMNKTLTAA